jgi:hypothetical protein
MLDMFGASKDPQNLKGLVAQVTKDLDSSHDGKISKDEFIKGLMSQPSLRSLLNPFS